MTIENKELVTLTPSSEVEKFEFNQRLAKSLSASDLLLDKFKGNIANVLIAVDIAQNLGMQPLQVMNNLYIVQGKPSFSAHFMTSLIIRKYGNIYYEERGQGDDQACRVWSVDSFSGEKLYGTWVSVGMAKSEGWYGKNPKWKNMTEQMLRYRAASFFAKNYLANELCGMQTTEELTDITVNPGTGAVQSIKTRGIRGLKERLVTGGSDAAI
jgi:hypothetical protein